MEEKEEEHKEKRKKKRIGIKWSERGRGGEKREGKQEGKYK